jgi:hypothetical protein
MLIELASTTEVSAPALHERYPSGRALNTIPPDIPLATDSDMYGPLSSLSGGSCATGLKVRNGHCPIFTGEDVNLLHWNN